MWRGRSRPRCWDSTLSSCAKMHESPAREVLMLRTACLRLLLAMLLFALPAHPQLGAPLGRCGPHPPDPDWPRNQMPEQQNSLPSQNKHPMDMVRLRHDAQELAELSATIPADVNRANRGLLSKDLLDKLK